MGMPLPSANAIRIPVPVVVRRHRAASDLPHHALDHALKIERNLAVLKLDHVQQAPVERLVTLRALLPGIRDAELRSSTPSLRPNK